MNTNGDPTTQTTPVTPPLADPNQQSGSTGVQNGTVSTPQQIPASQQSSSNTPHIAELIDQYEKRHRALMSEKDKKDNELRQSIAAQVELQKQLTALQEQSQSALTSSAQTTQSAIDQVKQLGAKNDLLEAENTRNKILLEKPELAPYAQFIPASADAEKVKAAIAQLEEINKAQMARFGQSQATPQLAPLQTNNILESLYGNKPGMTPALNTTPLGAIPPSAPAQMAPLGTVEDQNKAIEQILVEARKSGDPEKFAAAMEEAKHRAEMLVKNVMGGS